jgi:hypothetical protein
MTGHCHSHLTAGTLQAAQHLDRFVGRDPPSYAERHTPSGEPCLVNFIVHAEIKM